MFKSWFSTAADTPEIPEPNADLSLGALLVRMAKADKEYHVQEIGVVDRVLGAQFNLSAVDAAKMRATCEALEKIAPDTEQFVTLIRENISEPQRRGLMEALVDVARADGITHPQELALIRDLGPALHPEGA